MSGAERPLVTTSSTGSNEGLLATGRSADLREKQLRCAE